MGDSKRKVADFIRRVHDEAVPTFERATVAFYGVQNGRIVKDRTGVLLRIADAMFILTASHDLREIVQQNIPLCISWNERTEMPIPLHDSRFHTTEYESQFGERDVVRDVAAIKLGESAANEILAGGRTPISLCDINMDQDRSPALFFIFGFPQAWFQVEQTGPKCSPLIYATGIYDGEHSMLRVSDTIRKFISYSISNEKHSLRMDKCICSQAMRGSKESVDVESGELPASVTPLTPGSRLSVSS